MHLNMTEDLGFM